MAPDLDSTGPSPDASDAPEEARAWAAVLTAWEDDAAHKAYLNRFADLDGLTRAGTRYRAVLAERPADAIAARWRDEIVKRATVQGLAMLPRTAAPAALPRWVKVAAYSALASLGAWAAWKLFDLLSRGPAL
ncbi:MAG: hypothetical protein U0229_09295 [Anaeromyxobacter sp.]